MPNENRDDLRGSDLVPTPAFVPPDGRRQWTPEETLLAAMLEDAVKEFRRGDPQAALWFRLGNVGKAEAMTFDFICEHFGWSKQRFLEMLFDGRKGAGR